MIETKTYSTRTGWIGVSVFGAIRILHCEGCRDIECHKENTNFDSCLLLRIQGCMSKVMLKFAAIGSNKTGVAVVENEPIKINRQWYWNMQRVGYRYIQQHKPTLGPRLSRPCFVDRNDASVSCCCSWVSEWLAIRATTNNKEDYQDFDHAASKSKDIRINQDHDGCRAAVLRLVLSIEAEAARKELRINWDDDGAKLPFSGLFLEMTSTEV
jgi:hypothetical protein